MGQALLAIVAEDQEFCRAGLSGLLGRRLGFARVLGVRTFDELVAALEEKPAVSFLTLDLLLPGTDTAALTQLTRRFPHVKIVVVTASTGRETILACLAAGVHGYIPKSFPASSMLAALRFVLAGHVFVPSLMTEPAEAPMLAAAPEQRLRTDLVGGLTDRQREVTELLCKGQSNKEIARSLRIAPGTVKVHVNAAFRRLGVHNRVSAAAALHLPPPKEAQELVLCNAQLVY